MKYTNPKFQTSSNSQAYKDSWDRMFGEPDTEAILDELTALGQEMGGYDELREVRTREIWVVQDGTNGDIHGAFLTEEIAEKWLGENEDNGAWHPIKTTLSFSK